MSPGPFSHRALPIRDDKRPCEKGFGQGRLVYSTLYNATRKVSHTIEMIVPNGGSFPTTLNTLIPRPIY